jgi:ATP-binding cassette, subfamily B, bacterial
LLTVTTIGTIWPFVRPYRRTLAVGGVLAALEVAVDLARPWPLKWIVDDLLAKSNSHTNVIALSCAALAVIVATTATLDYVSTRILSSTGLHMANDTRESVFAHLNRLSLRFHGANRVGDLATRVTGDVDRTQDMIVQGLSVLAPNIMLVVGMGGVMIMLDPAFAALALALTPLLAFVTFRSTRQLKRAEQRARKAVGQVAAATNETLSSMALVQTYALEPSQEARFGQLNDESLSAGLDAVRQQARFSPMVDITGAFSTIAVLWFGSRRVQQGVLTVGELLVFVSYVGSIYKPLKALAKLGRITSKGTVAAGRIMDVLSEAPQIADTPQARRALFLEGRIEFKNVSFSHGLQPVLHNIDLAIEPGETVALVGPTGSGKSTIASLIPRLIDPSEGVVALDGQDVRALTLKSVRSQVAMVLQDCTLLHGTLRDNIALGRPWASHGAIVEAARLALVDEFALRLPDGLDTLVGERGANLSGGQRQRVAIARAILRQAPILILDEPTSALDTESEQLIVEALSNLPTYRTTLVIAHRMSTIRRADRTVQDGTHEELTELEGRYRRLSAPDPATRIIV